MNSAKTIFLCVVAACVYGIIHDQITARICVEYFTVGHPPVFMTDDPTILGIGWGIIATWWVGLILGVGLALAANVGLKPKRKTHSLVRPVMILLLTCGAFAFVAGIVGWVAATNKWVYLRGILAANVPQDKHVAFLTCGFAHSASYAVGLLGGIFVIVRVWKSRSA
jgi:hypothetical protein